MKRQFTVTIYIIYENKVLLHFHKKYHKWLAIGGHIEENELPEDAALREVREETGLDVEIYNNGLVAEGPAARTLITPMHLSICDVDIPGDKHQHIDLNYYAIAKDDELAPEEGETKDLKWFTAEDLEKENIPPVAKQMALSALKLLGTN